jgi:hypothetical protein
MCVNCTAIICQPCGLFWQTQGHPDWVRLCPADSFDAAHRDGSIAKTRTLVSPGVAPANPLGPMPDGMTFPLLSDPPSKLLPMKSSEMIRRNEAASRLWLTAI